MDPHLMARLQEEEIKRLPIQLAIAEGKKRKSEQTLFIHYCYESESVKHDTIPILENALFALALLRTRLADNIKEAKELLEKLLSFEMDGRFPVYLHEYPNYRDDEVGAHLLPCFYFVLKDYGAVLGAEFVTHLQKTCQNILKKLEGATLSKRAEAKRLGFLGQDLSFWTPTAPSDWGHYLIAAQMTSMEEQKRVWSLAARFWHPTLQTYIGPSHRTLHEGTEPALSLYDLFMSAQFQEYSSKVMKSHPLHMHAALVHPFSFPLPYALSSSSHAISSHKEGVAIYFGDKEHVHSLLFPRQGGFEIVTSENGFSFTYDLTEENPAEEASEVQFFCNVHPDNTLFVNGKKATLFQIGDEILLRSKKVSFLIRFTLESGEAKFLGHILRANRPLQQSAKGENVHEAYDWKLSLRTLQRKQSCQIKASITIYEGTLSEGESTAIPMACSPLST